MRWLDRIRMRVQMLFRRGRAADRLDDELRFHLEQQIAENIAAGMDAEEARHAAMREFGNPAALRDQARETWSWNRVELVLRDLRIAARTLLRTPGFAAIAILVMALGIGANIALFTVVRSVLLKPLPFRDPDRLVRLYEHSADDKFPYNASAGGVFAEWKKQSRSFSDMAISGYVGYNLSGTRGQLPENVRAFEVTWNLFPLLGVDPALGRGFTQDDDRASANGTVILSWGLWKRRFGGDPAILNQTILLDAKPYTVIGIMPAWFSWPDQSRQLWTPLEYREPADQLQALDEHNFIAIGRLKPGVTVKEAGAELSVITRRIHDQHLDNPFVSKSANIRSLLDSIVGEVKTPLYVLLAATGCVLLIACLNVANLLVARGAARRKEMAIRAALGGSRMRLLREQLMESLILSAGGGVLGVALATLTIRWLLTAQPEMARAEAIHPDSMVGVFALALVVFSAAFTGVVSSLSAGSRWVLAALQESSRTHSGGLARTRLRKLLLTLEVGLTVVLLTSSGLLLRSYARLRSSNLGCITQNVLTMSLDLPEVRYKEDAQRANFFDTLLARVRSLPGVQAASYIFPTVPGAGYGGDSGFRITEHPPLPQGQSQYARTLFIDPGYFATMGIPIVRGRIFSENQRPGHPTEIIVSETLVRRFFSGEDPLGKHIHKGPQTYEIVGVCGDTLHEVSEPAAPAMYFALDAGEDMNSATLVIRSDRDVTQFALPVQRIVQELDRDLPVSDILTMDEVIGRNTADASFDATLLLIFAASSLLLAAVGLFGVLSYIVAQRTTEIGVRIALGAQRGQLLRFILADGLRPALYGLVMGLAGSAVVTRLIQSMLYQTQALDPGVFVLVSLILLLVAAMACLLPAWRASRIDPMQALRTE
ncbi:MAG: ABC transporter permease [Silvibacterium sp.]